MGLDYVKVDASLVHGIDTNPGNQAFLKGLCAIAGNMGLQTIAEGVQSEAELNTLLGLGFDGVTGPAVSRQWETRA
jgi:EAL domain-containing protein (putative c-di-GMP-specific phosphodiesterase class I)